MNLGSILDKVKKPEIKVPKFLLATTLSLLAACSNPFSQTVESTLKTSSTPGVERGINSLKTKKMPSVDSELKTLFENRFKQNNPKINIDGVKAKEYIENEIKTAQSYKADYNLSTEFSVLLTFRKELLEMQYKGKDVTTPLGKVNEAIELYNKNILETESTNTESIKAAIGKVDFNNVDELQKFFPRFSKTDLTQTIQSFKDRLGKKEVGNSSINFTGFVTINNSPVILYNELNLENTDSEGVELPKDKQTISFTAKHISLAKFLEIDSRNIEFDSIKSNISIPDEQLINKLRNKTDELQNAYSSNPLLFATKIK